MDRLFRIQDAEGRGPFRPGLSWRWVDDSKQYQPPAIFEDFGFDVIRDVRESSLHCGTACRDIESLRRWFNRSERRRLKRLGYYAVSVVPDQVFAESEHQVLFGCREPLSRLLEISLRREGERDG